MHVKITTSHGRPVTLARIDIFDERGILRGQGRILPSVTLEPGRELTLRFSVPVTYTANPTPRDYRPKGRMGRMLNAFKRRGES